MLPRDTLVDDVPFTDYIALDAINASGLKTFLRSPAHFWHDRHEAVRKETAAMRFGTLVHLAVLEPDRFAEQVRVAPAFDKRTKAGRLEFEAYDAARKPGDMDCTPGEMSTLQGILMAVQRNHTVRSILAGARREATLLWEDAAHNVDCKARYDAVDKDGVIVDIKTTVDARNDPFGKDMLRYGYGLSAAHYLEGARQTGVAEGDAFMFVAIEKEAPYGIRTYMLHPDEIIRSHAWRHKAMADYSRCRRLNEWPCYEEGVGILEAPKWAPKAIEFEGDV